MSTNFPTSLDTLTNPTSTDKVDTVDHAAQHANANDAIEALQAKVGADSSAVTTSHDYKLSGVTGSDKSVSLTGTETLTNKTLTSPTINSPALSADSVDAITEIASALKSGADGTLVTGTAGSADDLGLWNADGDLVSVTPNTGLQVSAGNLNVTGLTTSEIAASTLVIESEGIASNDNDTTIPTSAAVIDYIATATSGLGTKQYLSATDVAVGNTTTETTLITTSVGGGTLSTNNGLKAVIYITNFGIEESLSPESTLTLRLKYGSTTIATTTVTVTTTQVTPGTWKGKVEALLLANASTSAQDGFIDFILTDQGNNTDSGSQITRTFASGTATEDSTGALNFVITAQWNQADANNQFTLGGAVVEKITA